jgi:phosphoribosylformimino-5-aminoimidazole carboxamide ribotide isomerase
MSFVVYPAIDLLRGKVVRLKEGDPARLTSYSDDPARTARSWLEMGAKWLHVVNLDGAFGEVDDSNQLALHSILKIAEEFGASVQFGGGIRSQASVSRVLDFGVTRAILGTVAIENPDVVAAALGRFGSAQIAVGIDARDGLVRVRGWKDNSGISAIDLTLQMKSFGLSTAIFTDVGRDGLGIGLNIPVTLDLAERTGLDVIASGGVHAIGDVIAAKEAGLAGVILGRALYEGTIDLDKALKIPSL